MLAAVACEEYRDIDACVKNMIQIKQSIHPDEAIMKRYDRQYEKYRMLYPALKPVFKEWNS